MSTEIDAPESFDNYLPCEQYAGAADADGIFRFTKEDAFYFSFLEHGQVILRSEGYTNMPGRDNGIASVLKNALDDAAYAPMQDDDGTWVLLVFAKNNQEIARTCPFATKDEALAMMPSARAARWLALSSKLEDDYLVCHEYEEQISQRCKDYSDFICFQHPNTHKYYFAWVTADNRIILRSEGYPNEGAREVGMASVIANRENRDRFKVEEKHGLYYLLLTAGNYQEIGRSCPKKTEAELWLLLAPPVAAVPLAAAAAAFIKPADKDDDYLLCDAYENHPLTDTKNNVALFTHSDGKHYFVFYHPDGNIRLRSEGFVTMAKRAEELVLATALIKDPNNFSVIEKAGYQIKILKDSSGREVGRSCPKKKVLAAVPPVAAPIMETPSGGGFKWWWLLPLLLIPLFLWWKSCNKPVEEVIAPVPVVTDTVKVAQVAEVPHCDLKWILFDFDKFDIHEDGVVELDKVVKILQENATYKADLRGFTDEKGTDAYNQELSRKRSRAAKDYLVSKGIDAARIEAEALSESEPVAKNTVDDSGRHFNRRVELYVLDSAGKQVCKSIAPDIPVDLKN
jgi:uncharacterized protein YegP (UPF0339 family)